MSWTLAVRACDLGQRAARMEKRIKLKEEGVASDDHLNAITEELLGQVHRC